MFIPLHHGRKVIHGVIGHDQIFSARIGIEIGSKGTVSIFLAQKRQITGGGINGKTVHPPGVVRSLREQITFVAQIDQFSFLIHQGAAQRQLLFSCFSNEMAPVSGSKEYRLKPGSPNLNAHWLTYI